MRTFYWILLFLFFLMLSVSRAQQPIAVRLEAPTSLRLGEQADVRIILRNPYRNEIITLTATATYMVNDQQVTSSASTQLTIDNSVLIKVAINLGTLTYLDGSAKFDGQPVVVTRTNSGWEIRNLTLPADDADHVVELKAQR